MLTAAQIERRRSGIGSSEIAAVVGLSPFETALDVWARKKGLDYREDDNAAMDLGNRLEPVLLDLYRDRVGPVATDGQTYEHPQYPWALASPDGRVSPQRGVECKVVGWRMQAEWGDGEDDVPPYFICQAQWQMFVCDFAEVNIAALLLGDREFCTYRLTRDEELIESLRSEADRFWREHVLADVMPAAISPHAAEILRARYPREKLPLQAWTPDALLLASELADAKAAKKAADAREKEAADKLRALIGDSLGFGDAERKATWKADSKGKVSWKNVAEALSPSRELITTCTSAPNRVLRLKGFNGGDEE